jgi:hypothetical protein
VLVVRVLEAASMDAALRRRPCADPSPHLQSELDALVIEEARELVGRQVGPKARLGATALPPPAGGVCAAAALARLGIDGALAAQPKLARCREVVRSFEPGIAVSAVLLARRNRPAVRERRPRERAAEVRVRAGVEDRGRVKTRVRDACIPAAIGAGRVRRGARAPRAGGEHGARDACPQPPRRSHGGTQSITPENTCWWYVSSKPP